MEDQKKRQPDKEKKVREAAHDKTLADSFPTSDPPSTIPDPADETTTGADSSTTGSSKRNK